MRDFGNVKRGADARHHSAANETGAIERNGLGHDDRLLRGYDANFAEGAEKHQMRQRTAVIEPRFGMPVEMQSSRSLAQIGVA